MKKMLLLLLLLLLFAAVVVANDEDDVAVVVVANDEDDVAVVVVVLCAQVTCTPFFLLWLAKKALGNTVATFSDAPFETTFPICALTAT